MSSSRNYQLKIKIHVIHSNEHRPFAVARAESRASLSHLDGTTLTTTNHHDGTNNTSSPTHSPTHSLPNLTHQLHPFASFRHVFSLPTLPSDSFNASRSQSFQLYPVNSHSRAANANHEI
ncbi:hypothetical protein L2E82_33705 [Cichorium intybus]|uniref:Uncharacterized protein n=1 Tax=Cichorium intybus TaxID=13427 RepID=A0ACB9BL75_CICIN|nr:hypothetical protein L2E82_33705 [Cichorium intybus]